MQTAANTAYPQQRPSEPNSRHRGNTDQTIKMLSVAGKSSCSPVTMPVPEHATFPTSTPPHSTAAASKVRRTHAVANDSVIGIPPYFAYR